MKINIKKLILVILIILVVLPNNFSIGSISIYKITCIFSIMVTLYIILNKDLKKVYITNLFFIMNVILSVFILFTFIFMENIQFNDYFEILRFLVMGLITINVMAICKKKEYYIFFLKGLCIATTLMAILGIVQYFNPFNINEKYIYIYAPTQYHSLVGNYKYPRIVSTKPNPTQYGFIAIIAVYIQLMYFKYYKHKWVGIASIALILTSLMMTLSRTTQIAFVVSIIVYCFMKVKSSKGIIKALIALMVEITIIFAILQILPEELTWRLEQSTDLDSVSSWNDRIGKWEEYIEIIDQNLLFGIGPVKNLVSELGYVDSEFFQILIQYGLIGFLIYIITVLSPLCYYKKNRNITIYYLPIVIAILICNIAATTFLSSETSIIIYVMLGILFASKECSEKIEKE